MAALAAGYDSDDYRFIDSIEDYKCVICHCVTKEPTLTTCCGNHYCQSCIKRVRRQRKPCPLCSKSRFDIFLDKKQKRRILALKIHCTLRSQGCQWRGTLGDLKTHTDLTYGACGYVKVDCHQCRRRIQRKRLDRKFPITCPNACQQEKVERGQLDDHLNELCPLQKIDCEFKPHGCSESIVRKDMQNHLENNLQHHLLLTNRHLTKEVSLLKQCVDAIESISLVVPATFTIHHCRSVLQSDDTSLAYKLPFLTHPYGYRLQLHVYCLVREGKLHFTLGRFDDTVSTQLSNRLTPFVTLKNQISSDSNLHPRGEFELKSNEVVRISIPSVRVDDLLHLGLNTQYVVNDTLCCTFDVNLS